MVTKTQLLKLIVEKKRQGCPPHSGKTKRELLEIAKVLNIYLPKEEKVKPKQKLPTLKPLTSLRMAKAFVKELFGKGNLKRGFPDDFTVHIDLTANKQRSVLELNEYDGYKRFEFDPLISEAFTLKLMKFFQNDLELEIHWDHEASYGIAEYETMREFVADISKILYWLQQEGATIHNVRLV